MPEGTRQFHWVGTLARTGLVVWLVFLGLALIATVAWTVTISLQSPRWTTLAPWVLAIAGELAMALCCLVAYGLARAMLVNEHAVVTAAGILRRIETVAQRQAESTGKLIDLVSLSDQAKSLIYRDRELEALREVFHEDLMRQDYKTAEALIDSLAEKFGYADEAVRLRQQLAESRKATLQEKIDTAIARIQKIIDNADWPRAVREAQRLVRLFPSNPKVASVPERIEAARTKRKRELLRAYGEAVKKNDVDRGIELLQELDGYLAPQEAEALAESARGVFKAKLHNLGVQFAICVTESRWAEAIATGEQIIGEFPNSRMSHEVRSKMDQLKARATGAANK